MRRQNIHQRHWHTNGWAIIKPVHSHESRLRLHHNVVSQSFGSVFKPDEPHPDEVGMTSSQRLRFKVEFGQVRPLEILDQDIVRSQGFFQPSLP